MRFACPACKTVLQAPEDRAGARIMCPTCRQTLQVPGNSPSRPATPPPGPSAALAIKTAPSATADAPVQLKPVAAPSAPATAAAPVQLKPAASAPAAATPPGSWLYSQGGKRLGPVSWEQLRQLAASGQLQATALVWTQGMAKAAQASTIANLMPPEETITDIDPSAPPSPDMAERLARKQREQPTPVWKKTLAETAAVGTATYHQTVRPISYFFGVRRQKSLSRQADEARLALGQRLYDADLGDPKLRAQIRALGERILSIEAVKGVTRDVVAERRGLLFELANPALAAETPPPGAEAEHKRARTLRDKLAAQDEKLKTARPGLRPRGGTGWRRIGIGYGVALCGLVLAAVLLWPASNGPASNSSSSASGSNTASPTQNPDSPEVAQRPPIDDKDKDPEEIVDLCGPSVALIRSDFGGGTGFMIRPNIVATNAHVIDSALSSRLKVYFPSAKSGGKDPVSADVIYFDRKRDLAFLKVPVPPSKIPPLQEAQAFQFKSGRKITIIGCPGVGEKQLENAVSTGVLSTETEVANQKYYQLGASVNPGNSGGPVFNAKGHIIGVVTLKAGQEQISYCIPWKELCDGITKMEKHKDKERAEHRSDHRLHACFQRAKMAGGVYLSGMRLNLGAIQEAERRRLSEADLVRQAKAAFDGSFPAPIRSAIDELEKVMPQVQSDENVMKPVRDKMAEMWTNFKEIKNSVDNARGPAREYRRKYEQASEKFREQVQYLRNTLGADERLD